MLNLQKSPNWYAIRGGMGLGDSLYLQGVVRYFVEKGERLEVCSKWPEVFRHYGDEIRVVPFRRNNIQILAHYSLRKPRTDTNQWQDCCITARIQEPWSLELNWKPQSALIPDGKPYIAVSLPRIPMDRIDGFGLSLMPDWRVLQRVMDSLQQRYRIVQIGSGKPVHQFSGIDIDLANKTTVGELIDVAHGAAGFLGYCSFIVPLAESFNKPSLIVWSHKGLQDKHAYIRQITPRKVLSKPSSHWVMDNNEAEIDAASAVL